MPQIITRGKHPLSFITVGPGLHDEDTLEGALSTVASNVGSRSEGEQVVVEVSPDVWEFSSPIQLVDTHSFMVLRGERGGGTHLKFNAAHGLQIGSLTPGTPAQYITVRDLIVSHQGGGTGKFNAAVQINSSDDQNTAAEESGFAWNEVHLTNLDIVGFNGLAVSGVASQLGASGTAGILDVPVGSARFVRVRGGRNSILLAGMPAFVTRMCEFNTDDAILSNTEFFDTPPAVNQPRSSASMNWTNAGGGAAQPQARWLSHGDTFRTRASTNTFGSPGGRAITGIQIDEAGGAYDSGECPYVSILSPTIEVDHANSNSTSNRNGGIYFRREANVPAGRFIVKGGYIHFIRRDGASSQANGICGVHIDSGVTESTTVRITGTDIRLEDENVSPDSLYSLRVNDADGTIQQRAIVSDHPTNSPAGTIAAAPTV